MFLLVSGGSASGKSELAETLVMRLGERRLYIATMEPFDAECERRIERHRQMRKEKKFETAEVYTGLKHRDFSGKYDVVLLECMSNLLANEMYSSAGSQDRCTEEILEGIEHLRNSVPNLVVVTNEVFADTMEYDESTLLYIQRLGLLNKRMAQMADTVVESVASVPVVHKGTLLCGCDTN